MRKYLLLYKILFLSLPGFAQLNISAGTQWVNSGNVTVNVQDINLVNNGTFVTGNSILKFSGNSNNTIGGSSLTTFYEFQLSKNNNAIISLLSNININNKITFNSGLIDLNQKNISLTSTAILNNENENSRIIGPNGGEVSISLNLNHPANINPGNLGAILTSNSNLGSVTIKRGHANQSGTGLSTSINRYFNITNGGNNINTTLRFKYFDAELNGQNESLLNLFQSTNNGSNWSNQSFTTRDAAANYVEKTGLNTLALLTLAAYTPPPPPVTGLVFNANRTNTTQVQLTWTSATETNMSGYEVQRRLDNEVDFTARTFVNSLAPGGNSNTPLSYSYTDANSYNGTSYYRLKIVDLNNNFIYSDIKSVTGKVKGGGNPHNLTTINITSEDQLSIAKTQELTTAASQKITVGPNPNNGNFWFSVSGIEKETVATLYTIDGKVIKQFRVSNQQQLQVNGLSNGMYLLKVPGIDAFKVVVQGSSNAVSNVITSSPIIKN